MVDVVGENSNKSKTRLRLMSLEITQTTSSKKCN